MTSASGRIRPTTRAGRTWRVAKWATVVLWIAAVVIAGKWAGKLDGATETDQSKLLAHSAQSTQVIDLERKAGLADTTSGVVVFTGNGTLTAAQRTAIDDARQQAATGTVAGTRIDVARAPSPVAISTDGTVAAFSVPLAGEGDSDAAVRTMRKSLNPAGAGLTMHITGSAGSNTDSDDATNGIDGTLLLASLIVVVILLLLTYRSPVLWLLPLVSVYFSLKLAQAGAYGLAHHGGTVTGLATGILTVLVFGAGTDYALLLVARYREELRRHADRHDAMGVAMHRTFGALAASASTVVVSMLCLLAASFGQTRYLGPVLAIGVVCAFAVSVTLLPALLLITGRWVFWPRRPGFGSDEPAHTIWHRIAAHGARTRPRPRWIAITVVLLALGAGLASTTFHLTNANGFRTTPDSVRGQQVLDAHFPDGQNSPATVIASAGSIDAALAATKAVPGVASVTAAQPLAGREAFNAVLKDDPASPAARATVQAIRRAVGPDVLVGGSTAVQVDINATTTRDNLLVVPLILAAVLIVLILLLRALIAPLVLIVSVALSFAAAYGLCMLVFRYLLHYPGTATYLPLYSFLFLVALGVDYTIFLMHRTREEAASAGTRAGVWQATAATGGVITSAGLVLAGTFAVLATLPLIAFVEVGTSVAVGVLLDTFVVRTLLVPSVIADLGDRSWWPAGPPRPHARHIAGPDAATTDAAANLSPSGPDTAESGDDPAGRDGRGRDSDKAAPEPGTRPDDAPADASATTR